MIPIDLKEYDYDLPAEKIAQYPLAERDRSRLLLYKNKIISEDTFINIDHHLPTGSLLVFNNTKVIRARLIFLKESGARIEVFCLEPLSPDDYAQSFSSKNRVEWKCLIGNTKKWKHGILNICFSSNQKRYKLFAEKIIQEGDAWRIRFTWDADDLTFGEVIEATGHIPLPPYLNRPDEADDSVRYQTIYSLIKGSVAAPTAGLHFTKEVFNRLMVKEIQTTQLTLHVGAGTFQPIKSHNILEHRMHPEHFCISAGTIELILKNIGSIIGVGTTSVRTLESLYRLGLKLMENPGVSSDDLYLGQWEAYSMKNNVQPEQSLEIVLSWMLRNNLTCLHAPTRIIIIPGYDFRLTNGMITNFHQPESTLLLLISAWVGVDWRKIYRYALENNFRFLSYGDSSLLLK
ncbi:MAG: S-adenosylmethionine tRNA ribosyltransferase [Odoribacter sp.]|nr:S-adenosylmethionine tRNA ribosyltransferase [Odoribacter sp.]